MAKVKMDHTITLCINDDDDMAAVYLDGNLIMLGNMHDFHPGCHNINEWGPFEGPESLAMAIRLTLCAEDHAARIERPECHFNDNGEMILGKRPEKAPSAPRKPKVALTAKTKKTLVELDKILSRFDQIMVNLAEDCTVQDELDAIDPDIYKAFTEFDLQVNWTRYGAFRYLLKHQTDIED